MNKEINTDKVWCDSLNSIKQQRTETLGVILTKRRIYQILSSVNNKPNHDADDETLTGVAESLITRKEHPFFIFYFYLDN